MKTVAVLIPLLLLARDELTLTLEAAVLPNFYPFGQSEGDQFLPENDDGSSGIVSITIQFPFFDQNHNSLFVNNNGVISFLVEVSQFTPDAFPLGDNRSLVAPFWADVNTRNGGDVFYRETTDPNLLQQATNDVTATFVDQTTFKATWLLIATWYKVAFYGASGIYTSKRNTFQAVLITDGRHSFVNFNYNNITWTTGTASSGNVSGLGGIPAQAGFNAGDGIRYFNIPGSRTHEVIDLPTQSNIGIPGRWMFRVDLGEIEAITCPALPPPSNGTRLRCPENKTTYDTVCQFSCNDGYIGSGSPERKCQRNGTWSGQDFTCKIINCTSLTIDPAGPLRMSNCDNHYGAQCNFSCAIGYRLNGSLTVTCVAPGNQHPGVWNSTIPTCEVINCTALTIDSAAPLRISSCDNHYGAQCNFSCAIGYRLNGSSTVTCVASGNQHPGVWNTTIPTCEAISCPALPALSNGTRLGCPENATMYYNNVCQFLCNDGYIGSGSQVRRCQHNGTWSGQDFNCKIINCTSLTIDSAGPLHMGSCDNHYGAKCTFSCACAIGYRLNGSSTVTCVAPGNQHPGVWNNTIPTCEAITCPALPEPSNGTRLGCPKNTTVFYNTVCQFSCNDGYIGSGSQSRRCQQNGTWTGQDFTCQVINCTSLTIDPAGLLHMSSCDNHYGAQCNFSCTIGYRLNGSSIVTCVAPDNEHPGVWNNTIPSCEAITCPALPGPSNGRRLGCPGNATMLYDTVCQFSCNDGYIRSGSPARRCQSNGTWSGQDFTCQVINCTFLTIDPAGPLRMSSCNNHYGAQCNFSCAIGYCLNDSSTVTCVAPGNQHPGVWNNTIPTCEAITCPVLPAPSNGTRLGCPGNATMYYNTVCQFSCNDGYKGSGSQARSCQHNGTWSGQDFTCQVINCTSLTIDPAGSLRMSGCDNHYGARCNFSCAIGYRLNGSSTLTCVAPGNQHPGVWNTTIPKCEVISCPALPAPSSGTRLKCPGNATMYYNTVCQFSCNDGFIGSGSQARRCQHNGTWSGQDFTCQLVTCPALTSPSNGTRLGCPRNATMYYDTVCQFSCNDGYIGSGSQARRCQHDGTWSGQDFTCQMVTCPTFLAPTNGELLGCNTTEMLYNTVCRFSCDEGSEASGSMIRRCTENGTWSGTNPICTAVTCPRLSPPSNGELLGCNTTEMLYKTVCSFSCNEGFEAKGSVARRCTENGTWSGTYLVCEGINKNGSTLKPAGRKPNALLEILGERSDTPMHACL